MPRGKENYIILVLIFVEVLLRKNFNEFCQRVLNKNSLEFAQLDIYTPNDLENINEFSRFFVLSR